MKTKRSGPMVAVVGFVLLAAGVVCSLLARGSAIGDGAGDTGELLYALSLILALGGIGNRDCRPAAGTQQFGGPEDRRPCIGAGVSVRGVVLHWFFLL